VVLIYNKQSDLDWYESLAAHPIPYIVSPDPPARMDVTRGLHVRPSPDTTVQIGYLEISGAGFTSLRESIKDLERKIYATALAQAMRDTAQVEAADTQREDRKTFSSSLMAAAQNYERAERECWRLMAAWGKEAGEITITYNRDFDDVLIATEMIATFNALADSGRLTTRTLLRLLQEGERLPADLDIEAELRELDAQNAAAAAATLAQLKATAVPAPPAGEV